MGNPKSFLSQVDGFIPVIDVLAQELGLMTAVVYGIVWRYCQMRDGVCYASLETIANHANISRRTVDRHMGALCEKGYLADTTPNLTNAPHTYKDTGKVKIMGLVSVVTERSARTESPSTRTESPNALGQRVIQGERNQDSESKDDHGASAQEQLQRPPMLKAKLAPKSAPEQPEPGDAGPSRLLSATPARTMLRDKFHESVTHPDGHSAPKKFPTLAMALEFDKAAERLNSHLESAINYALSKGGINTITRLVNYLANFDPQRIANGGKNNVSPNSRRISRPIQPYAIADPAAFTGFGSDD